MRRLARFLRLPLSDKLLLLQSAALLLFVIVGLRLLPFRKVQRLLAGLQPVTDKASPSHAQVLAKIVRAVFTVSRRLPAATCLSQALTAQTLLGRHGYPTYLRLGVAKDEGGKLEAHAWLEYRGKVIIGGSPHLWRYTPLPPLGGERA